MRHVKRRRSLGFTLTEIAVVLAVVGMMAGLFARFASSYGARTRGVALGELAVEVHNGVEDFARKHRAEIISTSTATPVGVPGVADVLHPTLAELNALGHLTKLITPAVFRAGNFQVAYTVKPAGCVPATCGIEMLTYIDAPVLEPNANRIATTVLAHATQAAGSRAGGSEAFAPDRLRGLNGAWDAPNPVAGNPVGIFAMLSSSSDIGMDAYVRIQDTRDPDLQGDLTVKQKIKGQDLESIRDITAGRDLKVTRNVDVTQDLKVTGITTLGGKLTVNNDVSVTGKVDVGTDLVAVGKVKGDTLVPTGAYAVGTACTDEGATAKRQGGSGMVVCIGGAYRALITVAAGGDACTQSGAMAKDANDESLLCMNGRFRKMSDLHQAGTAGAACTNAGSQAYDTANNFEALLCRSNPADPAGLKLWFRVRDMVQNLQFIQAKIVSPGDSISKPVCSTAAGMSSEPILNLIPKAFSSSDGGFHFYATTAGLGSPWVIKMEKGDQSSMEGTPSAIAQIYCYYP